MGITGWGGNVTLYVEADLSQAVGDIIPNAAGLTVATPSVPVNTNLWDVATWDTDVWAAGTTWTDITADVRGLSTSAKFSRQGNSFNGSSATVTLDNRSGNYSPGNPSSIYRIGNSTTIGIRRPFRIRATFNDNGTPVPWPLFTGFILSWDEALPEYGCDATVTVSASDVFANLARFNSYAQTPQGAGERSDQRIARILANAGYTGARYLDVGVNSMQATTLASNTLTELKLVADSEGGALWCGPDGAIYFDGQNALIQKARSNTVQVQFSDSDTSALQFEDVSFSYSGDLLVNMAAYARVGSTAQRYASPTSRSLYGDAQDSRTDLLCTSDAQALTLATRQVALFQDPEVRVESLRYKPMGQQSDAQTYLAWSTLARQQLQLRSLVQATATGPSANSIYRLLHVSGMSHDIPDTTQWTTGLEFSSASVWSGLLNSLWDTAVWDSERWSW